MFTISKEKRIEMIKAGRGHEIEKLFRECNKPVFFTNNILFAIHVNNI